MLFWLIAMLLAVAPAAKLHGASLRNRFHNPKDCGRGQLSVDLPTRIQRVGVS